MAGTRAAGCFGVLLCCAAPKGGGAGLTPLALSGLYLLCGRHLQTETVRSLGVRAGGQTANHFHTRPRHHSHQSAAGQRLCLVRPQHLSRMPCTAPHELALNTTMMTTMTTSQPLLGLGRSRSPPAAMAAAARRPRAGRSVASSPPAPAPPAPSLLPASRLVPAAPSEAAALRALRPERAALPSPPVLLPAAPTRSSSSSSLDDAKGSAASSRSRCAAAWSSPTSRPCKRKGAEETAARAGVCARQQTTGPQDCGRASHARAVGDIRAAGHEGGHKGCHCHTAA